MQDNSTREWITVRKYHERFPEAGSLNFLYEKARSGELLSIRLGARVLIASDALDVIAQAEHETSPESSIHDSD
jgi:hypothetical protein